MKPGTDFIGLGCGALIVNDKNEVLLIRYAEDSKTDPGMWARPGGKIDFGECGPAAAEREVEEEVGIKVKVIEPLEFTEVIEDDRSKHWIALGFLAKHVSGTPTIKEPHKHTDIGWFPINNIPENTAIYTRNSVKFYLEHHLNNQANSR